jgi:hypothetical protein
MSRPLKLQTAFRIKLVRISSYLLDLFSLNIISLISRINLYFQIFIRLWARLSIFCPSTNWSPAIHPGLLFSPCISCWRQLSVRFFQLESTRQSFDINRQDQSNQSSSVSTSRSVHERRLHKHFGFDSIILPRSSASCAPYTSASCVFFGSEIGQCQG